MKHFKKIFRKFSIYFVSITVVLCTLLLIGDNVHVSKIFGEFIMVLYWFLLIPGAIIELLIKKTLSIEFKDYKSIVEANYLLSIYIINIVFAILLAFICSLVYFLYKKTKTRKEQV